MRGVGAERGEDPVRKKNLFDGRIYLEGPIGTPPVGAGDRGSADDRRCRFLRPPSDGTGSLQPYPEVAEALAGRCWAISTPTSWPFSTHQRAASCRVRHRQPPDPPRERTGSAGMEASFVNFVRPGDPVVVGVNGVFGQRMCEVAERWAHRWSGWTHRGDGRSRPTRPPLAHPDPAIIAVVHAETSTGVRNVIVPLGEAKGNALLLVDMVTSLGGIEVAVDDWQVDIVYSGTQKCLGVPPGLAPLTVSERARERMVERPSSRYLDLNLLSCYVQGGAEGGRVYHHTAPVTMIVVLYMLA